MAPPKVEKIERRPFQLRYKVANHAVTSEWIIANSLEQAEKAGIAYCLSKHDGLTPCRFISVTPLIDAEDVLKIAPEVKPEPEEKPLEKPSYTEQRERILASHNPLSIRA